MKSKCTKCQEMRKARDERKKNKSEMMIND